MPSAIRQSLAGAELMTSPAAASRGQVVLVVLGDETDPAILAGVVEGLAGQATGVVVAGDTDSAAVIG